MTIPFLAIGSCLLLASNNPGSLHGIIAVRTRATPTWKIFEGAYIGPYEPVDLWNRGPNKMHWLKKTLETYDGRESSADQRRGQLGKLGRRMKPDWQDWALMFVAATIPLATAFILAFTTSYNTPRVGLACRSLTHLLYFVTQLIQMGIWMLWNRTALDDDNANETGSQKARRVLSLIFRVVFGVVASFIGIGGTLMQLIGVYRNCLCKVGHRQMLVSGF